VLFEIEGLTMAEIAEALGIPPGTVASRLRRARAALEDLVSRAKARSSREGVSP
jgi:RNA polymerase sigma-70 factor (ECF subfamily)